MKNKCLLLSLLLLSGCKKFVEINPPPTSLSAAEVFSNDAYATSAVLAIYNNLSQGNSLPNFMSGYYDLTLTCGRSADEFVNYDVYPDVLSVYNNTLQPDNEAVYSIWSTCYQTIFSANSVLNGLSKYKGVTAGLATELEGEAKFIRAFCHFYLANLYGDVPLILGIDYQANTLAKKSSRADVYNQIIADLKDATMILSVGYTDAANQPSEERVRPVQAAAEALLARVYLYTGDYAGAETEATSVISQSGVYGLTALDSVFLKNSRETIWSLQPVYPSGSSTFDGAAFILTGVPGEVSLSHSLLNAFEPADQRRTKWVGDFVDSSGPGYPHYYYPYKYKEFYAPTDKPGEYLVVLRLAEQYLIRAEARAQLGNTGGARDDLNLLRSRAGLPAMTAAAMAALPATLLHERQVEFFAEFGHRWFDLKRTGMANPVLAPVKPDWNSQAQLYPIPAADIRTDPNLLPQNPGYD